MTQDLTTAGPSRRSVAKGAAWAVPAVSVAAAAPSLAASTNCATPQVTVNCPPFLSEQQLTFTITNPETSSCDIPVGEVITVDRGGLAGVDVGPLNNINAGVELLFTDPNTATLTAPLAPGESISFDVFPRGLARVSALQNVSVTIQGQSASQGYTIVTLSVPTLPSISVAICGLG